MTKYVPNYYSKFKCTADKCKHNCCIGWEIDIDKKSLKKYLNTDGEFGDRLKKGICVEDGDGHFILSKEERCLFLNSDNLCDIIINMGEESLCEICFHHPRYRNFFDSREEIGLGLCCEAAAELILTDREKASFKNLGEEADDESEEESMFFSLRGQIIDVLQNRELSIDERIEGLFENFGIDLPEISLDEWVEVFLGLERLDPKWTKILEALKGREFMKFSELEEDVSIALEQLIVYFIFRHLGDGMYDGRLYERAAFAILSLKMIFSVCVYATAKDEPVSVAALTEAARLYSLEIEYSDENIEKILEKLE